MAKINGNDLVLRVVTKTSGTDTAIPIAHATGVTLDFTNALIDMTTKDSGSWEEVGSGRRSATMSGDGLLDLQSVTGMQDTASLFDLAIAGTQLEWTFGEGNDVYQGDCFIESTSLSGPSDDSATYSFSMKVNGTITKNFS